MPRVIEEGFSMKNIFLVILFAFLFSFLTRNKEISRNRLSECKTRRDTRPRLIKSITVKLKRRAATDEHAFE